MAFSEAFRRKVFHRLRRIYCRTASRTNSLRDLRSLFATESRSEESSGGRDMDRTEDLLGIPSPLYYSLILIEKSVKRNLIEVYQSLSIRRACPQLTGLLKTIFVPPQNIERGNSYCVTHCGWSAVVFSSPFAPLK